VSNCKAGQIAGSEITVEGNDSFGINLANTPMMTDGLTGNLLTAGQITMVGDRSAGVNIASNVTGNVTNEGNITIRGTGSEAYAVSGDINGGFVSNGVISNSGYRDINQRRPFAGDLSNAGREDLTAEDLRQAGSAINISGNISNGIFLNERLVQGVNGDGTPSEDADGNPILVRAGISTISQFGSAPAIIVDGDGDIITLGLVAQITDTTDPDFDGELQYGFINQGTVSASGLYDDVDATAVLFRNVTVEGGINNSGALTSSTFRAPNPTDLSDGNGAARVLVLGEQAIADTINNSGLIVASTSEAIDEIFVADDDRANLIAPRPLLAVAIDIEQGATVSTLVNSSGISAGLIGRDGTAIGIRDTSGTLLRLENSGLILTQGTNSDPLGTEETSFNLVAVDLSAATETVEIFQSQNPDATSAPIIRGDILLGSGDDIITASAGEITGDIDFGGGSDTLALTGETIFTGNIRNTDNLNLSVTEGATLALNSTDNIQISEALIDGTSIYRPVINGETGEASTLNSTGNIRQFNRRRLSVSQCWRRTFPLQYNSWPGGSQHTRRNT